ncbi:MAG: class I fructose-bisphosphate aldolase [Opitutaceae bacterium]
MSFAPALSSTVQALLAPGSGLLAADESQPTIGKRFASLDIPSTPATHLAYRQMLFTTPGLQEYISGVILFDETIRQQINGVPVPEFLAQAGMIPGIKVDLGTEEMPGFPDEKITSGLDGLRERLAEYRQLGARFTKWRAVITINRNLPSQACITANASSLAEFAALSQEAGLVPIVEPEVLMDGSHTLARCAEVTEQTLDTVFAELARHDVAFEGMLLKTAMVLPGKDGPAQASAQEIATATLHCLHQTVPVTVPGIVFLSGGQSDVDATVRLNAICAVPSAPWTLTFSYGRALQDQSMKTWHGKASNTDAAQAALHRRAQCNSLATHGRYSVDTERRAS